MKLHAQSFTLSRDLSLHRKRRRRRIKRKRRSSGFIDYQLVLRGKLAIKLFHLWHKIFKQSCHQSLHLFSLFATIHFGFSKEDSHSGCSFRDGQHPHAQTEKIITQTSFDIVVPRVKHVILLFEEPKSEGAGT